MIILDCSHVSGEIQVVNLRGLEMPSVENCYSYFSPLYKVYIRWAVLSVICQLLRGGCKDIPLYMRLDHVLIGYHIGIYDNMLYGVWLDHHLGDIGYNNNHSFLIVIKEVSVRASLTCSDVCWHY